MSYTVDEAFVAQLQGLAAQVGGQQPATAMLTLTAVPANIARGAPFQATFHVTNTTGQTMVAAGANPYRIGSQSPRDNLTWGIGRVPLPADLPAGQSVDVTATLTAPSAAGAYAFAWQMVQDGVRWIDGTLVQKSITV